MTGKKQTPRIGNEERRRSVRQPQVVEAWVNSPTASDDGQALPAMSLNISRHGVAFMLNQELPIGAFFTIDITLGEQRIVNEIRIISCRADGLGQYEIGAEFC